MVARVQPSPCSWVSSEASCSSEPEKINICRRYFNKYAHTLLQIYQNRCRCGKEKDVEAAEAINESEIPKAARYQQSSTRQLAFGAPSGDNKSALPDSPKQLNDFYNNATLSFIAKVLSFIVILVTVLMVFAVTDYNIFGWLL
ncbi:hypothetical protein Tcan_06666 [Toxocara canis]|uniref:Uncharacterized protein n=2 Tax=Toxocara canis TaxID=6265 RepID=A0A0B2URL8_TOXCA|nr:hypothetical protein Tcan_06666 [Toxocara canis]VDM29648.1 unnamed protein product [Toxocara canis]